MIKFNYNGNSKNLCAVVFDMDGIVTNSMPWHYDCWKAIFRKYGVDVSKEDVYKREGEKGLVSILNIFADKGLPVTEEQSLAMLNEKEEMFKDRAHINIFDGMEMFINRLTGNGTSTALVTGTSYSEMKKLLPPDIYNLFSVIVTGDMLERGKPNPDPYLLAIFKLGINPDEMIVIENAPLGIKSAKSAGLFTVAIETSLESNFLKEADVVLPDHQKLYELFQF
jgi:beta-phosphoglucomutase